MKTFQFKTILFVLASLGFVSNNAFAFPENVRHGYASCGSCHVSPTGGGTLTEYGQKSSSEFLSTWGDAEEAKTLYGAINSKDFKIGGDIRILGFQEDNNLVKSKGVIPMQLEVELGYEFSPYFSLAATLGRYGPGSDVRNFYVMSKPIENTYVRAGRFMRAYGLMLADHSLAIRKDLRLDQRQESLNLEMGAGFEWGEFMLGATTGKGGELEGEPGESGSSPIQEDGFNGRFVGYLGDSAYAGFSLMMAEGHIWKRQAYGLFFSSAITANTYVSGEYSSVSMKGVEDDQSTPDHDFLVTYTSFGWETFKGFHMLASYESRNSGDDYVHEMQSYGPGIKWYPRPHFSIQGRVEQRLDKTFSEDWGQRFLVIGHYYL